MSEIFVVHEKERNQLAVTTELFLDGIFLIWNSKSELDGKFPIYSSWH